ncbi:MAG: nucleotidyl transferase AbiEii/AbiGii toxin family protein [Elusimicrobia bacterium]|nr:nucleotidyl transferase AbiEii/AbiGii toxin family protein [Elusimicrobiota bacterium]
MLLADEIEQLAVRFHTTKENIAREYVQHVFLSHLYADPGSDGLMFKGGTSLRIVYQSPRYSEDLDFTAAIPFLKTKALFERTAKRVGQEIGGLALVESKPTTGGYFGIVRGSMGPWEIELLLQASTRQKPMKGELSVVSSSFVPNYNVYGLPEQMLVDEKVDALLSRAKPRDFYDLYFILRKPMGERKSIAVRRKQVLEKLEAADRKFLYNELKAFLPKSHWAIIQQLPDQLKKELGRL